MSITAKTKETSRVRIYATFSINFRYPPEFEGQAEFVRLDIPTNSSGLADVRFAYETGDGHIQLYDVDITNNVIEWLKAPPKKLIQGDYPDIFMPTYTRIRDELESAARQAIEYVKYFLGRDEIVGDVISPIHHFALSLDGEEYFGTPHRESGKLSYRTQNPLTYEIRIDLQKGLNDNVLPFVAMRHLYRAIQESNPSFKWVDATIAAELAVKEALIRAKPELGVMIENMPSPPIKTLYGIILEKYLGEKSPYVSAMNKGAEKRNKIVHQPLEVAVTLDEAQNYVNDVMQAIHHLYGLLYPNWKVAKDLSNLRRLGC